MNLDISYEELQAMFVSPSYKKIVSPYRIKRIQKGRHRFYFTAIEEKINFYISLTSAVSKMLPNPHLSKWRGELGNVLADEVSKTAAHYGTLYHIIIAEFLKKGELDFDKLNDEVCDYLVQVGLPMALSSEWFERIHKDMLSFFQFVIEKNVEPVAIEFPIVSDRYGIGTLIDLVCTMDFNGKRVNAEVDFKSGKKGFFEAHEMQLIIGRDMWNDLYSDEFPITHIFNFAPNDWRKTPSYKLKNQSKSILNQSYKGLVDRCVIESWNTPTKTVAKGKGVFKLGQKSLESNVEIRTFTDFIKEKENANKKRK